MGTLANQAEIGVWFKAFKAFLRDSMQHNIRLLTNKKCTVHTPLAYPEGGHKGGSSNLRIFLYLHKILSQPCSYIL